MEHEYFKDRISAYFDRELKHEEEHMIAEHLESCDECQKLYKELEKLELLVEQNSGLKDNQYWEQSAQKIEKLIHPEKKTEVVDVKESQWRGLGWKVSSLVAVAAVVVFIAVNYNDIQREIPIEKAPSSITIPSPSQPKPGISDKKENEKDGSDALSKSVEMKVQDSNVIIVDKDDKSLEKIIAPSENRIEEPTRDKLTETSKSIIGMPTPVPDTTVISVDEKDAVVLKKEIKAKPATVSDQLADISISGDSEKIAGKITSTELPPVPDVSLEEAKKTANKARDSFSTGMSFEKDAIEKGTPDSLDQRTLEGWRISRDSLIDIIERPVSKSSFTKTQGVVSEAEVSSRAGGIYYNKEIELELLKCNYNIALLTEDEGEYQSAYEFIEERANDTDYKYMSKALEYLKILDKDK